MNSVENRNHTVMSFLIPDHAAVFSMIGYHSNSWPSCFLLLLYLHAVWSTIVMILSSACSSVCLWRCALWRSGSV